VLCQQTITSVPVATQQEYTVLASLLMCTVETQPLQLTRHGSQHTMPDAALHQAYLPSTPSVRVMHALKNALRSVSPVPHVSASSSTTTDTWRQAEPGWQALLLYSWHACSCLGTVECVSLVRGASQCCHLTLLQMWRTNVSMTGNGAAGEGAAAATAVAAIAPLSLLECHSAACYPNLQLQWCPLTRPACSAAACAGRDRHSKA
jgi:hypothetical protein